MFRVTSADDPRIAPYRNLRDRTLRGESLFIAEGELLALRLLESPYQVESLLVADQYAERIDRAAGSRCPVYVAPASLLADTAGFNFHRGVLAAGRRGQAPTLDRLLERRGQSEPLSLVVCPEVTQAENLGLVFRTAAAFGVDGVVLGERCCDPLSRRALRLSMGGALRVPFARSANLSADLHALRDVWHVQLLAAVLDDRAERLGDVRWPPRAALVLGNEFEGIRPGWLDPCNRRLTIPMRPGTDSLNLGVAAGIFVYEMMMRGRRG